VANRQYRPSQKRALVQILATLLTNNRVSFPSNLPSIRPSPPIQTPRPTPMGAPRLFVSTGTTVVAATQPAGGCTFAAAATVPNPASHAANAVLRVSSVLNPNAWARLLSIHPDQSYATTMTRYIHQGVPILYDGPEFERVCPNWDSTQKFRAEVSKSIREDILLGRKSGPYDKPPCPNFIASPLGAFVKKHSSKIRIIHDLSWPPNESVNAFIPPHMCSVSYISVDDAIRQVKLRGRGSLMSKLYLKDAYKCVTVGPEDRHYLGSSWVDDDGHVNST
jgi:hypothetical protein